MFTLVKFSCGCIGTTPVEGVSTIVLACDGEGDIGFHQRDIDLKTHEPMPSQEIETYQEEIEKLIYDGYRMRSLKRILDIK